MAIANNPEGVGTVEEIAARKAKFAYELIRLPVWANDMGMQLPIGSGFPEAYIKSFGDPGRQELNESTSGLLYQARFEGEGPIEGLLRIATSICNDGRVATRVVELQGVLDLHRLADWQPGQQFRLPDFLNLHGYGERTWYELTTEEYREIFAEPNKEMFSEVGLGFNPIEGGIK